MAALDTFALRSEARYAYIEGHFIGTVLLAIGFVEQVIVARVLEKRLTTNKRVFVSTAISLAREARLFGAEMLDRAALMVERRNGYAHLRATEEEHSFARRFLAERRHPQLIREQDAQDAVKLMDDYFRASLGLPERGAGTATSPEE